MELDGPLLAWHGDPELKAYAVQRMKEHAALDEIVNGVGYAVAANTTSGWHGCFHGCLTTDRLMEEEGLSFKEFREHYLRQSTGYHEYAERLWGFPYELSGLLDDLFEGLPREEAPVFAVEVTEAIPVGADLSEVADLWEEAIGQCEVFTTEAAAIMIKLLREAPVPE